jgi:hypothetical protein
MDTMLTFPGQSEEPLQGGTYIRETSSNVVLNVQCLKSGTSRPAATLTYPYKRGEYKSLNIKDDSTTPEGVTLKLSLFVRPD